MGKERIEKLGITKSPWKVAKENEKSGLYILGSDYSDQVVTGGYNKFNTLGVNEMVDAQLIAVAPEMLEALIDIAIDYRPYTVSKNKTALILKYNMVIDVIEKATNKSWEEIKGLL